MRHDCGSYANGMKLASEPWLYQRLTQFRPGFDHERDTFGSPLLDARLHPTGAYGVDEVAHGQPHSRNPEDNHPACGMPCPEIVPYSAT